MKVPVLLVGFRRPDLLAQTLEHVRRYRPERLFLHVDGPRPGRPQEREEVLATQALARTVDWPCQLETRFQPENLGCARGVTAALDWFFSEVESGIVLEDDLAPEPTFFTLCEELLVRYRDEPRVMAVQGNTYGATLRTEASYGFSRFLNPSGWASWARAHARYDFELSAFREADDPVAHLTALLEPKNAQDRRWVRYWVDIFSRVARGEIDSWAYRWIYAVLEHRGLVATPAHNLIRNDGFDERATHTTDPSHQLAGLATWPLELPLRHPPSLQVDIEYDRAIRFPWTGLSHLGGRRMRTRAAVNKLLRVGARATRLGRPTSQLHPVNALLAPLGIAVHRPTHRTPTPAQWEAYRQGKQTLQKDNRRGFAFVEEPYFESGEHPESHIDFECQFASAALAERPTGDLLDIGSYRHFLLGLLACRPVTTLDVRARPPSSPRETVVVADASRLPFDDESLDGVMTLCAIEHFGLGRYGDAIDAEGDVRGVAEMKRVLKPGGVLILSTTITGGAPTLAFNAHRIYNYALLEELFSGLELLNEAFFDPRRGRAVERAELDATPAVWSVYVGHWMKPR